MTILYTGIENKRIALGVVGYKSVWSQHGGQVATDWKSNSDQLSEKLASFGLTEAQLSNQWSHSNITELLYWGGLRRPSIGTSLCRETPIPCAANAGFSSLEVAGKWRGVRLGFLQRSGAQLSEGIASLGIMEPQLGNPSGTHLKLQHYGTGGFEGGLQLGLHYAERRETI